MSNTGETDFDQLTRTLTENFNLLADEVQLLSDRKTVLEHKLRFAHEQFQILADRYAPSTDSSIASTLAQLQLPAEPQRTQSGERTPLVPLPSRLSGYSKQATAEAIRDGRRASQLLASLKGWTRSDDSNRSASIATRSSNRLRRGNSSFTTFHEQDFTVPGKRGSLLCPFRQTQTQKGSTMVTENAVAPDMEDTTPHRSADPICAALYEETHVSAPPSTAGSKASNKCPIRFLDQHSPEEVARYFENHKHEIPRSHEVCVKRYQRNEIDVRKLDAKYGNLVNMLQGLGQKHQPMLPKDDEKEEIEYDMEYDKKTKERVENWAKSVSQHDDDDASEKPSRRRRPSVDQDDANESRQSRFSRVNKEIRVGESPSRPWGIAVPWDYEQKHLEKRGTLASPPPAPPLTGCPFSAALNVQKNHTETKKHDDVPVNKVGGSEATGPDQMDKSPTAVSKCPFGSGAMTGPALGQDSLTSPNLRRKNANVGSKSSSLVVITEKSELSKETEPASPRADGHKSAKTSKPKKKSNKKSKHKQAQPQLTTAPAFMHRPPKFSAKQIVFNGPVFFGVPSDQAAVVMQKWQAGENNDNDKSDS